MINIESEDPFDQVGRCHSVRVLIRKRFFWHKRFVQSIRLSTDSGVSPLLGKIITLAYVVTKSNR